MSLSKLVDDSRPSLDDAVGVIVNDYVNCATRTQYELVEVQHERNMFRRARGVDKFSRICRFVKVVSRFTYYSLKTPNLANRLASIQEKFGEAGVFTELWRVAIGDVATRSAIMRYACKRLHDNGGDCRQLVGDDVGVMVKALCAIADTSDLRHTLYFATCFCFKKRSLADDEFVALLRRLLFIAIEQRPKHTGRLIGWLTGSTDDLNYFITYAEPCVLAAIVDVLETDTYEVPNNAGMPWESPAMEVVFGESRVAQLIAGLMADRRIGEYVFRKVFARLLDKANENRRKYASDKRREHRRNCYVEAFVTLYKATAKKVFHTEMIKYCKSVVKKNPADWTDNDIDDFDQVMCLYMDVSDKDPSIGEYAPEMLSVCFDIVTSPILIQKFTNSQFLMTYAVLHRLLQHVIDQFELGKFDNLVGSLAEEIRNKTIRAVSLSCETFMATPEERFRKAIDMSACLFEKVSYISLRYPAGEQVDERDGASEWLQKILKVIDIPDWIEKMREESSELTMLTRSLLVDLVVRFHLEFTNTTEDNARYPYYLEKTIITEADMKQLDELRLDECGAILARTAEHPNDYLKIVHQIKMRQMRMKVLVFTRDEYDELERKNEASLKANEARFAESAAEDPLARRLLAYLE
ncbi:unnamed protein product [Caenorhabditis bovis]|uniref:Uncharacterized protein n=1 Tax=Caenorhabditis bovis TaxID=2654633 RepID=A0A8S1F795_9PELO|nr:unnamed protein product [Caenorhabditis bovis]